MEIKPFYSGRAYYDITGDNGEKYVFVPQEFVEKGFVQDGKQFYSPGFLTPGALSTASAFTLPNDSALTGAAKSIYQEPTKGFVWKADGTFTNFSFVESGSYLLIRASGTDVMKIDTSGNLTVLGNIVANGTV